MQDSEKILIVSFEDYISQPVKGERIIIRFDDIDAFMSNCHNIPNGNLVFAIWLHLPDKCLSDITFSRESPQIPIILHCSGVGSINQILDDIHILQEMQIKCFMPCSSENFKGIKILSSLGIETGILFDNNIVDSEKFLDLASFACVSPMRHAAIEPFDYIWRNIGQDNNLDFSTVYLTNPFKYIHVDVNSNCAYSYEMLASGKFTGKLNDILKDTIGYETKYKEEHYYKHFMELTKCAKCSAFKICNRTLQDNFEDCEATMKEVYELCELRDSMERQNNQGKEICQL